MPTYKYEGACSSGEKVSGVIEVVSRNEAVVQIRQSCEVVLSLKEVPKAAARAPLERFHRISAKSLALTSQQFAIILKAGLPLVQTVDLVADQCVDKKLGALLRQVSEGVSNGWSLSYSFSQRGAKSLPVTFRESVRAGEESGDLLASFQRMSACFERMNKTRESVVSALTYPAFVMVVAAVVVAIIMGCAVPTQFSHTMSTLLTSGTPIMQAIDGAGRTMTNRCLSDEILDTLPGVEGGHTLGECMSYARELPAMLVQMTAVGEATGSLESTLDILAEYYDNEVDVLTKRVLGLLETAIIVFLAVFVVFIPLYAGQRGPEPGTGRRHSVRQRDHRLL